MTSATHTSHLPDDVIATKETDWLGAHVVSAACFCPRAAVLAFHRGANDVGQELDYTPPLDYLPNYDIEEFDGALEQSWIDIGMTLVGLFLAFVLTKVLTVVVDARLWLAFGGLCVWSGQRVYRSLFDVATLYRQMREARDADAARPVEDYELPQPVHWWRLVKSGFTPVEYEDSHEDPQLHVAGRPWRVLHDGPLRIPVFRKWHGKAELSDPQVARIAAYCHLIDTAEGGSSPYGVVLFGADAKGMTVPNNESSRQRFFQGLRTAREAIQTATSARLQVATPPGSHCQQCPLGRPRQYQSAFMGSTGGNAIGNVFRTRAKDGRLYHSPCGDFFRWVPPHTKAAELELF